MSSSALPVHPRTGLQAVGIVGGRPVWPILGAEDDPANPVQPAADPAPAGDPAPVDPAPAADPDDPAPSSKDEPKTYDQAYVEKLRKEAASHRTAKAEQEAARKAAEKQAADAQAEREKLAKVLEGLNKVLNPEAPKDEPLDPTKLQAQLAQVETDSTAKLAEKDAEIRQLRVENALPDVFSKLNAKPGLTRKVLKADGVLSDLDPTSKTFAADLESAVKKAIDEDASLKATPAVTKTGTEPTGRSGATDQLTSLAGLTPEQIVEAQKQGRLKKMLGG